MKRKVEANGVPLSEWGVEINYGIKTGNNDVFIIDGDKRNEILNNCITEEERIRTAEIIRPILRGRDIEKYKSNFANKWIIATFPSKKYNIEDYPSLKNYLLSFGVERLEQSGKTHIVNGEKIKARKKTGNKWFETQDSISYWDNFSRPKIVWKRVGSKIRFCIDYSKMLSLDSTCFLVGDNLDYLNCFFNSKIGNYMLQGSPTTGTGDLLISVQAINPLRIPIPSEVQNNVFSDLSHRITSGDSSAIIEANEFLYDMFGFTKEEKERIEQG